MKYIHLILEEKKKCEALNFSSLKIRRRRRFIVKELEFYRNDAQ